MTRDKRRMFQWLELRGWRLNLSGKWLYDVHAPVHGIKAESAMRRQIRSDLRQALSSRDTSIRVSDRAMVRVAP